MTDILNTLLPFIPEKYRALVAVLLTSSPLVTRAIYALMNGRGIKGTFAAIWLGTNTPPQSAPTPPSVISKFSGPLLLLLAAILVMPAGLLLTGCKSTTPQEVTYQAAATGSVAISTALVAYDQFAGAGKTTPAQNAAVKAAYEKYQAAFAAACDAGQVYAAMNTTNAPAASAAIAQAVLNANQESLDLINLITSFGVKL